MSEIDEKNAALIEASRKGNRKAVWDLLVNGAEARSSWSYALRVAARYGHIDIVNDLLDQGANVNAMGDQALTFAIGRNDIPLAELLVKRGAKVMRAVAGIKEEHLTALGRRELLEKLNFWGEAEKIAGFAERGQERAALEDIFRLIYGDYKTLADLRVERAGSQGHTGLTLAAMAGLMPELIGFALLKTDDRLTAEDFLTKDRNGRTVVDALRFNEPSRGLSVLFNAAFWRGQEKEVATLLRGIDPVSREKLDLGLFYTESNLAKLDALIKRRPRP